MRVAIYPGSFNPWHAGHTQVLLAALQMFDKVIVAPGINPDKDAYPDFENVLPLDIVLSYVDRVSVHHFNYLLPDYAAEVGACAIIRGLRNTKDFEDEKIQQYWYEDLGLKIPVVYIISGRDKVHLSSSAIRAVKKAKEGI
jgi:pantetheine-phosphate adenylyltransferase